MLREGDRLAAKEFLRRWDSMPDLKQAELIGGIVFMPSPVNKSHGTVHVSMSGWLWLYADMTPGTLTGNAPEQLTVTDASGNFQFSGFPEGAYELTGERTGYLKSEFGARQSGVGGTPLRLEAGDKLTGLTLKLVRIGVITGRVLDENGEPVSNAVVHAVSRLWIRGQPFYSTSGNTETNDAGEYRMINLRPGRYWFYADHWSESFVEKQGGPEKRLVGSFYPNSPSLDGALLAEVQPGHDVAGVNFQLRTEQVFHIRGKLAGKAPQDEDGRPSLSLSASPHGLKGIVDLDCDLKDDGRFDCSRVPAGSYDLELLSDEYKQAVAKLSVEVRKSDVSGLLFPIANRLELKGVVHRLDSANSALAQLKVFAADTASPLMSHPYAAHVESDGSFKIENVWPGNYVFGIGAGAPGDYVKSVQYGGYEVLGVPLELTASPGPFEITLSGGTGRIEGSIQPADSDVSAGGLQVVLISDEPRTDDAGLQLAKADQAGQFSFKYVVPGNYHAFAVADVDPELLRNRSLANQLQGSAAEVEVSEGGNLQIHVPVIAAEAVQRALSMLGL